MARSVSRRTAVFFCQARPAFRGRVVVIVVEWFGIGPTVEQWGENGPSCNARVEVCSMGGRKKEGPFFMCLLIKRRN